MGRDAVNNTVIDILRVEENQGDARFAIEALKGCKVLNRVHHVPDGAEAMSFLHRHYAGMPRSRLILPDPGLPRRDCREVLSDMESDGNPGRTPVVVLAISNDERDVFMTYGLHVNCFITEPVDLGKYLEVAGSIEDFWLTVVRLTRN